MTVLVRPVPKRVWPNGRQPFRPNVPTNNIRPFTPKTWQPPVPEPLPPAPLIGPKGLLVLGVLVLSQIWGLLKQTRPAPEPDHLYPPGCKKVKSGNYLKLALSANHGPFGSMMNEHIAFFNTGRAYDSQRDYYRHIYKRADGVVRETDLPRSAADAATYALYASPGHTCVQPNTIPGEPVPGTLPEIAPEVEPLPAVPVKPLAPPVTVPSPEPGPSPLTDPVPVEPGPSKPPIAPPVPVPGVPGTGAPVPDRPGIAAPVPDSVVIQPDGTLPELPPAEVPVTSPDAHFPISGGKPVVGNGPAANLKEMAKELGRLEGKLNTLLNPQPDNSAEWMKWIFALLEALYRFTQGTDYTLTEPCTIDPGETPRSITVSAPGSLDSFGVLINRMDALAELLQAHKDLRQPTCSVKPLLTGEWVSVNFLSDEKSLAGDKRLRKLFRYRDQTYSDQEAHIQHWENFEWQAGPVMVVSKGMPWGTPKVWAATAAEGKRVISHAAQIAGVDLTDPKHEWIISGSNDPRYGQPGTMRVDDRGGRFVRVTKRPGPDGLPYGRPPAT